MIGNPLEVEGVIKEDGTWLAKTINLVTPGGYSFEFTGKVQSINPWIVSGVGFDTSDWTEIDSGIRVGDKVRVAGLVNTDGIWVAETIELLDNAHPTSFIFFGPVVSIDPWNVRGVSLLVDGNTVIESDIAVGDFGQGYRLDSGRRELAGNRDQTYRSASREGMFPGH